MKNKRAPTLRDVASFAGVSTTTVSYYINQAKRFSPQVEASIAAAIAELGYRMNPAARSMSTGKTGTVGVVVPSILNPHFAAMVTAANRVAFARGYVLLLVNPDGHADGEQQLLQTLSLRVDGMLVCSRLPESELEWLLELGRPVVFSGRLDHLALPAVGNDDELGGYMLAQHLVMQGHRKIAYLGFPTSRRSAERRQGVAGCLAEHGLPLRNIDCAGSTSAAGEQMASVALLGKERPDAVICFNDSMAIGLMKEARTLGFGVPDALSVVGFDNAPFSQYVTPPLTTMDMLSDELGRLSMCRLIAAIDGEAGLAFEAVVPRLVLRASTRAR